MILEHALLSVRSGQEAAFEAAMAKARPLIAASPGFHSIEVRPPAEPPGPYLLLIAWDDIASHREGFRCSLRYAERGALLHPFYAPMPDVSYFGEPL